MYADLIADATYSTKKPGAALVVLLINSEDPADVIIGALSGTNYDDQFSTNPVEELGDDGVNEFTQGRHRGTGSLSSFWTAEWNDKVPTRQSFIGKTYALLIQIAPGRAQAGTVVDAFTGVLINRVGSSLSPRGNRMFELGIDYANRYSGKEWSELAGT